MPQLPAIGEIGGASSRTDILPITNLIYTGWAEPGSLTSDPVWRITRIDTTPGAVITELHANGKATYVNIWDQRASLPYS